jgi:hypothetical protein
MSIGSSSSTRHRASLIYINPIRQPHFLGSNSRIPNLDAQSLLDQQVKANDAFLKWRMELDKSIEGTQPSSPKTLTDLQNTFKFLASELLRTVKVEHTPVNMHFRLHRASSPGIRTGKARNSYGEFGFRYQQADYRTTNPDSKEALQVNQLTKGAFLKKIYDPNGYSYNAGLAAQESDRVFAYLASKAREDSPPPPPPMEELPPLPPTEDVPPPPPLLPSPTYVLSSPATESRTYSPNKKRKADSEVSRTDASGVNSETAKERKISANTLSPTGTRLPKTKTINGKKLRLLG